MCFPELAVSREHAIQHLSLLQSSGMASEEHLRILKQGIDEWNSWRKENEVIEPDFSDADLRGVGLRNYHLTKAKFDGANLSGVDFTLANLVEAGFAGAILEGSRFAVANAYHANFVGARLAGATLNQTRLYGANLSHSDLRKASLNEANAAGARFIRADLSGAFLDLGNFARANFTGAEFTGAVFSATVLCSAFFEGAKGLETCDFRGPCMIDQRAIAMALIPDEFLRGCGLRDWEIDAARISREKLPASEIQELAHSVAVRRLGQDPIQFHDCVISYSSRDEGIARRIQDDLVHIGVQSWFAPEDLRAGDRIHQVIADQIRIRDKLVVVISEHSVNSRWVRREVEQAMHQEDETGAKILVPVSLDTAASRSTEAWAREIHRSRHVLDFTKWQDDDFYQEAFERLVLALSA